MTNVLSKAKEILYISIYQALHFPLLFDWFFTGHFSVPRCLNAETDAFVEIFFHVCNLKETICEQAPCYRAPGGNMVLIFLLLLLAEVLISEMV